MRASAAWVGLAVLYLATFAAPAGLAESDIERGQRLFERCASCHTLAEGGRRMPGPSLKGVIGRRAGTLSGFDFSDAMIEAGRDRGLVWNEATLFDYLDDTDAYVPGTAMGFLKVADPEDRKALIAYLKVKGG